MPKLFGVNDAVFDRFTPGHVVAGFAFGALGASVPATALAMGGYEVGEQVFEGRLVGRVLFDTEGSTETFTNVASDLGVAAAGFAAGRAWRRRGGGLDLLPVLALWAINLGIARPRKGSLDFPSPVRQDRMPRFR